MRTTAWWQSEQTVMATTCTALANATASSWVAHGPPNFSATARPGHRSPCASDDRLHPGGAHPVEAGANDPDLHRVVALRDVARGPRVARDPAGRAADGAALRRAA